MLISNSSRICNDSAENCNVYCACALNMMNFGSQTVEKEPEFRPTQRARVAWITFRSSYVVT